MANFISRGSNSNPRSYILDLYIFPSSVPICIFLHAKSTSRFSRLGKTYGRGGNVFFEMRTDSNFFLFFPFCSWVLLLRARRSHGTSTGGRVSSKTNFQNYPLSPSLFSLHVQKIRYCRRSTTIVYISLSKEYNEREGKNKERRE